MININMSNASKVIVLSVYVLCIVVSLPQTKCVGDGIVPQAIEMQTQTQSTFVDQEDKNNKVPVVSQEIKILQQDKKDVLLKLRDNCHRGTFYEYVQNKDVQKYERQFRQVKYQQQLVKSAETRDNVDYIVQQVEKRNLPGALALIPMIESNLKVQARSHRGAVGLWQFMPRTGRALGLKSGPGYDGRRDVKASTHAALNYLEYLHKRFNGDWALALAAYNAGEGTVSRAMKRNKLQGKSTSFWSLKLPRETTQYVPKILGLQQYIKHLN